MAFTAATLEAAIQTYLQNTETTFVSYLPTIIKQAEDRISKECILPVNRTEVNLTLTNGSVTSDLPADFLAPFSLLINNAGVFTAVEYADVSYMRELFPNALMVGTPRFYSVFNDQQIILAPTPMTLLSGWLSYFAKPLSIVDDPSGTSWLGTNAEFCLLYACLTEAYTFLKGDQDLITLYETKYQGALAGLKKLGEGLDMGDAYRMGERRMSR